MKFARNEVAHNEVAYNEVANKKLHIMKFAYNEVCTAYNGELTAYNEVCTAYINEWSLCNKRLQPKTATAFHTTYTCFLCYCK